MQAFNASDVLYKSARDPVRAQGAAGREGGHGHPGPAVAVHARHQLGLRAVRRLQARAAALRRAGTATARATATRRPVRACTAPGLDATSYGQTTLQPGLEPADVRGRPGVLGRVHQPGRQRRVQHQGHGARSSARAAARRSTLTKTVQRVAKGEKATVTLPLNREPPLDTIVNITATVGLRARREDEGQQHRDVPVGVRPGLTSRACRISMTRPGSSRSPRRARR